jgi:transcriptional regulator with XRE-family HTH domain
VSASRDTRSISPTTSSASGERAADRQAGERPDEVDERRAFERELLYGEVVEHLRAFMADVDLTQRDLARRLKVSDARLSRIFTGRENLTLRTLADLGWATGLRFEVVAVPFEDASGTPAADDPPPPRWLYDHARVIAGRVRGALRRRT